MDLNKVMLVGNLGQDPEMRYLPSGDPVCDFSIAMNRRYRDKSGEDREETTWVRISAFGRTAEFANNYLRKGKAVFVEGRLRENSWERDGQKHTRLDVVAERLQFAYPRAVEEGRGGGDYAGGSQGGGRSFSDSPPAGASRDAGSGGGGEATEDDLPF